MLKQILQPIIQAYIERNVVMKDTWELDEVQQKGVKLPYVLMENKTIIINNFWLPIRISAIKMEIYNKDVTVGRVLYGGNEKIPAKNRKTISLEVRMSHITALFNMIRYLLVDTIPMNLRGKIYLRLLWMDFELPVEDVIQVPRKKIQFVAKKEKPAVEVIPPVKSTQDIPKEPKVVIEVNEVKVDAPKPSPTPESSESFIPAETPIVFPEMESPAIENAENKIE